MRRVLWVAAFLILLNASRAWAGYCQDCFEGQRTDRLGNPYKNAMCCLSDGDCSYIPDEYGTAIMQSSWCRVDWVQEEGGYTCFGESFTCTSGGGGTGGGGGTAGTCTVGFNDPCPAECATCERRPYLN